MTNKAVILLFYFGEFPRYAEYFFDSCKKNTFLDIVVFNDTIDSSYQDQNLTFEKYSLVKFNQVATEKLGFTVELQWAFKICDFRPALGYLFQDKIKDYEFWGYCDLDVIFGDLSKFIGSDKLDKYDVFSTKDQWMSGSFSLYRNTDFVNRLFMATTCYRAIFQNQNYYKFDEVGGRWFKEPIPLSYFDQDVEEKASIYDIVKHYEKEGSLRTHFVNLVREWPEELEQLVIDQEKLIDLNDQREYMYIHILLFKRSWRFYVPNYQPIPKKLYVSRKGLISEGDRSLMRKLLWDIRRVWFCAKGIGNSLASKPASYIVKRVFTKHKLHGV